VSESQTNFSHELQAMKKTVADLQGTDYAMKCSALEAKLQQTEAAHKAELFSLQQQLNKLLESSNTQTRGLADVAGGCEGGVGFNRGGGCEGVAARGGDCLEC
jgi:hypothetical protein